MADEHSQSKTGEDLVAIKERLREGRLERDDVAALERLVLDVERASQALRAAMVE
jgi:hypothetical protein